LIDSGGNQKLKQKMHTEHEFHEANLERMQMLEAALERAEAGVATGGDWDIIRYECGMPQRSKVTMETVSITRSE
jgi:hypothetical protein